MTESSDAISNMRRACIQLESFNDRNSYMRCQCEWQKAVLAIYTSWCIEYDALYDPHENRRRRRCLPFLSGYTSWGGGRVKGRVTPEVIGRSGQRAAIVNETHRSHQMLTFDWRRRSDRAGRVLCATPGVQRAARPRDSVCLPLLTFSSAASSCFFEEAVIGATLSFLC